jgi:hypothetical protein
MNEKQRKARRDRQNAPKPEVPIACSPEKMRLCGATKRRGCDLVEIGQVVEIYVRDGGDATGMRGRVGAVRSSRGCLDTMLIAHVPSAARP